MKAEVIISEGAKSQSVTNSFSQGRAPTSGDLQFLNSEKLALSHSTYHRVAQVLAHTLRQV